MYYSIRINNISVTSSGTYSKKVLKDDHLPAYGGCCGGYATDVNYPMIQGRLSTAGNIGVRHYNVALNNVDYIFSGLAIYNS